MLMEKEDNEKIRLQHVRDIKSFSEVIDKYK